MKRIITLLLCLLLAMTVFSLSACGGGEQNAETPDENGSGESAGDNEDSGNAGDNEDSGNAGDNEGSGSVGDNEGSGSAGVNMPSLNGKPAQEVYDAARAALAGITEYEAVTNQKMVMSYHGQSMTVHQSVISKVNGKNSYAKTTNDMVPTAEFESWYVDDVCYLVDYLGKFKMNMTTEEYEEQYLGKEPGEGILLNLPESWYIDAEVYEEDGFQVLKFVVSKDKYLELLEKLGLGTVDITDDFEYYAYFDEDGNIEKIVNEYDIVVSDLPTHVISVSTVNVTNVEITAPADADSFVLISQ